MGNLISIDGGGLRRFGAQMRALAVETKKTMNAGLLVVAQAAATDARSKASAVSTRIPATVRAGGTGVRVYVRAGGAKAPHAAAFEHHGTPGQFRHPVFGDTSVWVAQQAHPFLTPSVNARVGAGGDAIAAAIVAQIEKE